MRTLYSTCGRYGKKIGREEKELKTSETRCRPKLHTGYTRAGRTDAICVFFAQGRCDKGAECQFHHRIPRASMQRRTRPHCAHECVHAAAGCRAARQWPPA